MSGQDRMRYNGDMFPDETCFREGETIMNLLSLEYFLVTAEEMNFTKAAGKLYITQQSLSGHIKKLEDYFGCRLFDRGPPLTLTKEGIGLQRSGAKLLVDMSDIERQLRDIQDLRNGEITIGASRIRSNIYLPPILAKFNQCYPNVHVTIMEGTSTEIEAALHKAQIDLCVGPVPIDNSAVKSIPFWIENTALVVPQSIIKQYFPTDCEAIVTGDMELTLKDLHFCPFVAMDPGLLAGREFRLSCAAYGFTPKIIMTAKSLHVLIPLCLHGIGALVCPEVFLIPYRSQIGSPENPQVLVFPTQEVALPDEMCINYLKSRYMPLVVKEFIRIAKEEMRTFGGDFFKEDGKSRKI